MRERPVRKDCPMLGGECWVENCLSRCQVEQALTAAGFIKQKAKAPND